MMISRELITGLDWIKHTPGPANPTGNDEAIVLLHMRKGDYVGPVVAGEVDWDFPGDEVFQYALINKARFAEAHP